MKKALALLSLITFTTSLSSCGEAEEKKEEETVMAKVTLANAVENNNAGTYEFTKPTCSKNSSGLLTASFTNSVGAVLSFGVKGFKSTPSTYACAQAVDNVGSDTSNAVGDKFDICGIEITVLATTTSTSTNTYSTFRETTTVKPFQYAGACSLNFTSVSSSNVKGTLSCTKMVQTQLESGPRNPISPTTTVDATGEFECAL